jgi:hypothetical protein
MLDRSVFDKAKTVPLADVLARYNVQLQKTDKGWRARCPLPTHKPGDKTRSLNIVEAQNYWRCFNPHCTAKLEPNRHGEPKKGGDVIYFVQLMERLDSPVKAAEQIADWFGLIEKSPPHMETGRESPIGNPHVTGQPDDNPPDKDDKVDGAAVVSGLRYMQEVDAWFDKLVIRKIDEAEPAYWKRVRQAVKDRLRESYKNGQSSVQKSAA